MPSAADDFVPDDDFEADFVPDKDQPIKRARNSQPPVKSDQELGLDEGAKFFRGTPALLFADTKSPSGRFVANAKDAPGTEAYASRHAGDEMNDPGAQMLTGAALAAPLAAAAPAALAPAVSGAQQSAMMGQNPVIGAGLGLIPAIPAAARALDTAVGERAVASALAPPKPIGATSKTVGGTLGAGAGAALGHATGIPYAGYGGAAVGAKVGAAASQAVANIGRKLTTALAGRHLARLAASADPEVVSSVAGRYSAPAAAPEAPGFKLPDKLELNPSTPEPPFWSPPDGPAGPPEPPPVKPRTPAEEDAFWREAQRDWGVVDAGEIKPGNHTTAGGATAITPEAANDLVRLRAKGASLLGQLSKLRSAGTEHAPVELAQRAQEVMQQISVLEKTAASPFATKAKAVAELVKSAQRGATKEQLAHRAKALGLDDAVVKKVASGR